MASSHMFRHDGSPLRWLRNPFAVLASPSRPSSGSTSIVRLTGMLWDEVQTNPSYKDKTTMLVTAEFRQHEHCRLVLIAGVGLDLIPQHAGQAVSSGDRVEIQRVRAPVSYIHVPEINQNQARGE